MPSDDEPPGPSAVAGGRSLPDRRLFLAILLALALAPGLWLRGGPPSPRDAGRPTLSYEKLAARTPDRWPGELRLVGAWQLTSESRRFGGYSALLATDGGTLTAISDAGFTLRMRRPGAPGGPEPRFGRVRTPNSRHRSPDIEAATIDARSGRRWYAYEYTNQIRRFESGDEGTSSVVAPPAMRDWPANGGPEAIARLPDGRFIVLSEDPPWFSAGERPGLLFPADPVSGAAPLQFGFRPPIGYAPSDMAALPDGRVVILLRTIDPWPPFFKAMLAVADPADIAAGREWRWRKLADLSGPVPRDNYEGLAIAPDATGVTLWVISDDNFTRFQRTLLLQLHWRLGSWPASGPAPAN